MNDYLKTLHDVVAWAILPAALDRMIAAATAVLVEPEAARPARGAVSGGAVAVLPVRGAIFPHANLFTEFFGGAAADRLGQAVRVAVNDPNVGAIVLDIDSPGGAVSGVDELAGAIHDARGLKPIVAVANHLAASAAYWLASATDEVVVTPSGEVGSIGVFAAHADYSEALAREGVKVSLIAAGKFKTEGNPYEPLTDEARAAIQARVDDYYDSFVKAVARGRGVKAADVRDGFGQGRVVGAREAVTLGMADRVATLEQVVGDLARGKGGPRGLSADMRARRLRLAKHNVIPGSVEP